MFHNSKPEWSIAYIEEQINKVVKIQLQLRS